VAGFVAAGIATTLAAPASASTPLSYVFSEDLLTVRVDAFGPAANDVTVVEGDGDYTIHDPLTDIVPGEGCSLRNGDTHTVVCVGIDLIVNLWGGNDRLDTSAVRGGQIADLGDGDDVAIGGPGWDHLTGGRGNDVLNGAGGGDGLYGNSGADDLIGGPGVDTVSYNTYKVPVKADLDGAIGDDGAAGEGDTIRADVEVLAGGFAGDELTGGPGPNLLLGHGGNDLLDVRDGAAGDRADGGTEKDTCLVDAGDVRVDCP
jgi:Ca2+-binding RTX toxin-like protein